MFLRNDIDNLTMSIKRQKEQEQEMRNEMDNLNIDMKKQKEYLKNLKSIGKYVHLFCMVFYTCNIIPCQSCRKRRRRIHYLKK